MGRYKNVFASRPLHCLSDLPTLAQRFAALAQKHTYLYNYMSYFCPNRSRSPTSRSQCCTSNTKHLTTQMLPYILLVTVSFST